MFFTYKFFKLVSHFVVVNTKNTCIFFVPEPEIWRLGPDYLWALIISHQNWHIIHIHRYNTISTLCNSLCFYFIDIHFDERQNHTRYNESRAGKQLYWKEYNLSPKLHLNQFLAAIPSFEESLPVNSSNELCAKHSRFVLRNADNLEIWALKSELCSLFVKTEFNTLSQ